MNITIAYTTEEGAQKSVQTGVSIGDVLIDFISRTITFYPSNTDAAPLQATFGALRNMTITEDKDEAANK